MHLCIVLTALILWIILLMDRKFIIVTKFKYIFVSFLTFQMFYFITNWNLLNLFFYLLGIFQLLPIKKYHIQKYYLNLIYNKKNICFKNNILKSTKVYNLAEFFFLSKW